MAWLLGASACPQTIISVPSTAPDNCETKNCTDAAAKTDSQNTDTRTFGPRTWQMNDAERENADARQQKDWKTKNENDEQKYSRQYLPRREEETEFQKFIYQSTGVHLPIYGHDFLDKVSKQEGARDRNPVPADYTLMVGDQLLIHLSSQEVFGRGLASYLIKKDTPPSAADIRITFALQNLLGLAAMVAIITVARPVARWYGQGELRVLFMAAALACYGYACRGVPLALLERDFDYLKVAVIEILENIIFYAIAIPFVWRGHVETGLASAILLRSWGPTLLAFILKPVRPALFFHFAEVAAIADFGFSVTASSLVNIAVFSVPVIFVGKLSGMKELGQAQMAFSLYGNLLFVTAAVVRLNLSAYARLVEHASEFAATVNQHLQILAAALVPTIVLFAGLAPIWATLVLGEKWQGLSTLLLAQAPGYLLAAVFWGVLNPALLVSGRHRHLLFWLIGFSVFYSLLTRLFTPAWGAVGVAIAFSATEIVFHPLLFWIYGSVCGRLDYKKIVSEIITGVGVMGLLWFCTRRSLWLAIACVVIYLVLWYACNRKTLTSARKDFDFISWCSVGKT